MKQARKRRVLDKYEGQEVFHVLPTNRIFDCNKISLIYKLKIILFYSMSTSNSAKQLNYPLSRKITNRNPVFRSSNNFGQQSSIIKPFSRKPANQGDDSSLQGSKINEKQMDESILQKSLLQVQSVLSGGRSVRQSKFVRTNRNSFLSPKSKSKKREQSFSPDNTYGTQSMILRADHNPKRNILKDSIRQRQQVMSEQSSVQQNQSYLQKSISSNNLFRSNNKTRNMILSKFSQLGKKPKDKAEKHNLNTSIHTACFDNEKQERKKIEKINIELREKNAETQVYCQNLKQQNVNLAKQNDSIKAEVIQLKKRVQQLQLSRSHNPALQQKTLSQNNLHAYQTTVPRQKPPISPPQNKKCQKCDQKQKSNQKQVTYFENIIKKKQSQLIVLRRKQTQLSKDNSDITLALEQTRYKLNELLEHERISSQNQLKLQECVNDLKEEVAKLKDQLRYLKIENSVLLKIKNQNLKLKIDITKIQDQRDYFKMKVIEIHKKHGCHPGSSKSIPEKFVREKCQSNRRNINNPKSKKFYLDSTQPEDVDTFNIGIDRKHSKSKTMPSFQNQSSKQSKFKNQKQKLLSESQASLSSPYDTLFDLTSQESENSY